MTRIFVRSGRKGFLRSTGVIVVYKRHDKAYDDGKPFFKSNKRLGHCITRKLKRVYPVVAKPIGKMMQVGTNLLGFPAYLKSAILRKKQCER